MRVTVVIVTYANRFKFLDQTVQGCLEEGVEKIIVINNKSSKESSAKITKLSRRYSEKILVQNLDVNTGSAGGFNLGIQKSIKDQDCEFVWLLDDDNMPKNNSLIELKKAWVRLGCRSKKDSLLSYRPVKENIGYKEAILTNNPDLVLGRNNSFLGFHLLDLFSKIKRKIRPSKRFETNEGLVTVAPYGGFFFHKDILQEIGLPNKDFFVYGDDHEWTYRIKKLKGRIFLILNSIIMDTDVSWNVKSNYQTNFDTLLSSSMDKVFYSTRNRMIFELDNIVDKNRIMYLINIISFLIIITCMSIMKNNFKNIKIFIKAINKGLNKSFHDV